ncbi:hypothetical protein TCDM_11497 [Trypanosoma cruzi Dm28c]|uniref:Uncharacterized protein n=1 Tax=Trypanosoma cruzi Dm28c TaxID=1416333 RepID=V5B4M8_TRYCR|nr:hypothetical protein TCDM_11497 [Trypanosoma cruzi Dm28c]
MKRRKEEAVRVRRGSHLLWECCTACGGIALNCRTITHEDVTRSGRSLFVSAAVGVGAFAPDLSARWPRRALPTQRSTALVGHLLSHCSIVTDASGTRRGSGSRHRHECDRKRTRLLLRFEGAIRVAQRRAHKPHRGVRARHRALAAECLRPEGRCGGVPLPSMWKDS